METSLLYNLSTELLIEIFSYLRINELLSLRLTCRRFNTIIRSGLHLLVKKPLLATNQLGEEMRARSKKQLAIYDKLRVSNNWICGRYKVAHVYKTRKRFMPRLALESDRVWCSREQHVECFKRENRYNPKRLYKVGAKSPADIFSFVYKQNYLFSGLADGSVWFWSPQMRNNLLHYNGCHLSDINAVDLQGAVFATGSKDESCKIWSMNIDSTPSELTNLCSIVMTDRVWSLRFSPDAQYLLAGTAGYLSPAGCLIDVERQSIVNHLDNQRRHGQGILSIKWESPNVVWTCGYEACVRRWDLRTMECVQSWDDPFIATICSMDYDNCCTVVTGAQLHGRTVLYDTRKRHFVQMYFTKVNSPVYDLSFDATQLYTATDCSLNVFDFNDSNAQATDYYHNDDKVYDVLQRMC